MADIQQLDRGQAYDHCAAQLSLSLASIHTTTEILSQAIVQLCDTPEVVQPLREEVISVLREVGWSRTTFSKMRLLDSFLKETLRTRDTPGEWSNDWQPTINSARTLC